MFDIDILSSSKEARSASLLEDRFESLQAMSGIRLWLVSGSGIVLVDSSDSPNINGININDYDSSFLNSQTYVGTLPNHLVSGCILAVVYPVTSGQTTKGYLVLMTYTDQLRQRANSYLNVLVLCLGPFLILLFLALIYLFHQTAKPIKVMTKAVREYSNGHFDYPMEKVPIREFMDFVAAAQYLTDKMRNMNDYQKKFIANVSHDFRSPLTSIKGYTEAMLDGTIPAEMQEKYLKIILFETQRLSKLTSSLLQINQFEHDGIPLELSAFDINQAIKITTSAFEQQCTEKRITINLIFSQKTLLVYADENKIGQALQNLVDNAIKFSHHDSTIEIQTMESTGTAFISVKDHGIGIPKKDLSRIWERFYKSDLSRGKDKTGTGLGLSITKELIEAHKEHINVISTAGIGTEFTFTLRVHTPE